MSEHQHTLIRGKRQQRACQCPFWATQDDSERLKKEKDPACAGSSSRGDTIRTCDLVVPNDALYQAELHPGWTENVFKKEMAGEGFEPSKAYASRFTVCPLWPLG